MPCHTSIHKEQMKRNAPGRYVTLIFMMASMILFGLQAHANNADDTLTEAEKKDLQHLSEEEKLARDVYLYAFDKYALPISENISNSEQRHMNRVLNIMACYGMQDSVHKERGVFYNPELQSVYNRLTARVDISVTEALIVGATIEDMDIFDIDRFLQRTKKADLIQMYEVLKCGSRNHLRAYHSHLKNKDESYIPQYISQETYDAIVTSEKERGCGRKY